MVPSDEEIAAIQEAMQSSPDVALGSAEQFLLTLSSISELQARLQLWAFKLDYDALEKVMILKETLLKDKKKNELHLSSNVNFKNTITDSAFLPFRFPLNLVITILFYTLISK